MGDGAIAVVVVHGNDLGGELYAGLGRELAARGLRAVLTTLPGFDGEPPLPQPSWDAYAAAVVDAMAEHRAGVLLGHSMGGLIALLAAARRPAALAHLVLLEPAIFARKALARLAARRYLARVVDGERDRFDNTAAGLRRVSDLERFPPHVIARYLAARRAADPASQRRLFETLPDLYPLPFERVAVPTLLLTGADTGWRGRALAAGVRRRLPGATHRVIAGAAHWVIHERDAEAAALVAEHVG
jgi:pimeloyl-ACP methyl ester carboxylesterase